MAARMFIAALGFVCLISCSVAPTAPDSKDGRTEASSLIVSSAEGDAEAALSRGDTRLLGLFGYAREVPGAPEGTAYTSGRCQVRMIEGTSDDGPRELNARAREYARRYNERIISKADCVRLGVR